jgi:hypothetical protein
VVAVVVEVGAVNAVVVGAAAVVVVSTVTAGAVVVVTAIVVAAVVVAANAASKSLINKKPCSLSRAFLLQIWHPSTSSGCQIWNSP